MRHSNSIISFYWKYLYVYDCLQKAKEELSQNRVSESELNSWAEQSGVYLKIYFWRRKRE
jgi:hypothetical protein